MENLIISRRRKAGQVLFSVGFVLFLRYKWINGFNYYYENCSIDRQRVTDHG